MTVEVLRYAAFTRDGRGGNPAGVVLDATGLADRQMLSIAQAVGYSETAFVLPEAATDGRLPVRYFSPKAEVAFCGHATIATAVALAERDGGGRLDLSTLAGPVTVETALGLNDPSATLTSPPARSVRMDETAAQRLLEALGWTRDDLDRTFPLHVAFAGNHHGIVAARRLETLAALHYNYDALSELMDELRWTSVHAFWGESGTTFHARNAFPPGGVVEDPATGAAAAAFGAYLRDTGRASPPCSITVLQGHHMGSPSRLVVDLVRGTDTVRVSGAATRLASGSTEDSTGVTDRERT